MPKGVLLDTSFFLRFLNEHDPLFANADGYFRYFIDKQIAMVISTIAIAEYCVKGDIHELPLRNLQILPFNIDHAKRAGQFARIVFDNKGTFSLSQRAVIPNDSKLFAQADCEIGIEMYVSSDSESKKIFDILKRHSTPRFQFIDLHDPYTETFGVLDLK